LKPPCEAVGVGKNEQALSSMRGARFCRPETIPLRIEPEPGKVGQHVSQAGCPEAGHVFDEHGLGP
jgi:hypothetical protein